MAFTFYHSPMSTSSITAEVIAELEHGRPEPLAHRVVLSLKAGDTKKPEYLAKVNPNGRVPAIEIDGVTIWESAAITLYLGEKYGVDAGLYPGPGPKRGEAMKWVVWTNTCLAEAGARLSIAKFGGGEKKDSPDEAAKAERRKVDAEKALGDIERYFGILDGALRERDYLLGPEYSLADTHVWSAANWLTMIGGDSNPHSNLKAWLGKISARPALQHDGR